MKPLKPTAMDHSHYVRIHMTAQVPAGTTLADVTNPEYWANLAYRLKPNAIIEVLSDDCALDADLRVLEIGPTFAKVRVIRHYVEAAVSRKATPKDLTDEVTVDYGGKQDRWRVVHKGEVIKAGLATESEASKAAEDYRSKIAA